jgi:hypothetical protein
VPAENEITFTVGNIFKTELVRRFDVVDFNDPVLKCFIEICTNFCFNAGIYHSGAFQSSTKRANGEPLFTIEYLPTIVSSRTGKPLATPARINKDSGRIQVAMDKFIPMSVPMRMAIMCHEYSHYFVNDNIDNEMEADGNGVLIYLGLGYPRIEAAEAFLTTFIGTPSEENKRRYEFIKGLIDNFDKKDYLVR